MSLSPLQIARYQYAPKLPGMLRKGISEISVKTGEATQSVADQEKIAALFPNTYGKNEVTFEIGKNTSEAKKQVVGVILSGGQAPGGHNVVCGLYDALMATNADNVLYGFKGGPSGLLEDNYLIFDDAYINQFRNTGGFDMIGSGRTKLELVDQFNKGAENCKKLGISALVIIGAMTLCPPGACPPERITATLMGLAIFSPFPGAKVRSGILLVDGNFAVIFSVSAKAASFSPSVHATFAPALNAAGSFGA